MPLVADPQDYVFAFVLFAALLWWWIDRGVEKRKRRAACGHRWEYRSLHDRGVDWSRHCIDCGYQEPDYERTRQARADLERRRQLRDAENDRARTEADRTGD